MEEIKLIKVTYEYDDGTLKTLEKEDVQKYEEFLYSVIVLADSYGKNPNWDGLNWTITPGKKLQEIINELKNEKEEYYI
jgi:hypothetical protein